MTLLTDAVDVAAAVIQEGGSSTIAMIDNDSNGVRRTFMRQGPPCPSWELDCAVDAAGGTRAVLIVPVIEARHGEMLHILTVDLDWGFDLHRCLITRDGGATIVGTIEHYNGQVQLHPMGPGYVLIQAMHAYQEAPDDDAA